jgi:hypothetical protein
MATHRNTKGERTNRYVFKIVGQQSTTANLLSAILDFLRTINLASLGSFSVTFQSSVFNAGGVFQQQAQYKSSFQSIINCDVSSEVKSQ